MPQRSANSRSSWRRNQDSGCPATPVESSSPHSSELPVRGVAQIRDESSRSESGGNSGAMARLKHATRPHGNEITSREAFARVTPLQTSPPPLRRDIGEGQAGRASATSTLHNVHYRRFAEAGRKRPDAS